MTPQHALRTHCRKTYHRVLCVLLGVHGIRSRRLGGLKGLTRLSRGSAPHDSSVHARLAPPRFPRDASAWRLLHKGAHPQQLTLAVKILADDSSTVRHPQQSCDAFTRAAGPRCAHEVQRSEVSRNRFARPCVRQRPHRLIRQRSRTRAVTQPHSVSKSSPAPPPRFSAPFGSLTLMRTGRAHARPPGARTSAGPGA